MKIPNKLDVQEIAFNHSPGIDLKHFMNLYKRCTEKSYMYSLHHKSSSAAGHLYNS